MVSVRVKETTQGLKPPGVSSSIDEVDKRRQSSRLSTSATPNLRSQTISKSLSTVFKNDTIFKIRAKEPFIVPPDFVAVPVESSEPTVRITADQILSFRKGQAFYALSHNEEFDYFFVSTQYATPFARNAVNGFVPAQYFEIVDLNSKEGAAGTTTKGKSSKTTTTTSSTHQITKGIPTPLSNNAVAKSIESGIGNIRASVDDSDIMEAKVPTGSRPKRRSLWNIMYGGDTVSNQEEEVPKSSSKWNVMKWGRGRDDTQSIHSDSSRKSRSKSRNNSDRSSTFDINKNLPRTSSQYLNGQDDQYSFDNDNEKARPQSQRQSFMQGLLKTKGLYSSGKRTPKTPGGVNDAPRTPFGFFRNPFSAKTPGAPITAGPSAYPYLDPDGPASSMYPTSPQSRDNRSVRSAHSPVADDTNTYLNPYSRNESSRSRASSRHRAPLEKANPSPNQPAPVTYRKRDSSLDPSLVYGMQQRRGMSTHDDGTEGIRSRKASISSMTSTQRYDSDARPNEFTSTPSISQVSTRQSSRQSSVFNSPAQTAVSSKSYGVPSSHSMKSPTQSSSIYLQPGTGVGMQRRSPSSMSTRSVDRRDGAGGGGEKQDMELLEAYSLALAAAGIDLNESSSKNVTGVTSSGRIHPSGHQQQPISNVKPYERQMRYQETTTTLKSDEGSAPTRPLTQNEISGANGANRSMTPIEKRLPPTPPTQKLQESQQPNYNLHVQNSQSLQNQTRSISHHQQSNQNSSNGGRAAVFVPPPRTVSSSSGSNGAQISSTNWSKSGTGYWDTWMKSHQKTPNVSESSNVKSHDIPITKRSASINWNGGAE